MRRQLLFKVVSNFGTDREHEYRIYDNSEVEGFGEDNLICNYHSLLLKEAIVKDRAQRESSEANGISDKS